MSKKADNNWGRIWSEESEMECGVALQHVAAAVWIKWQNEFNAEGYPKMVGLGQVHDIWNMMYEDMKALYTLEKLVNNEYCARIIESEEKHD